MNVFKIPAAEDGTTISPMHIADGAVQIQVYGPHGATLASFVLNEDEASLLVEQMLTDPRTAREEEAA